MRIKSIILTNFKGAEKARYDFEGNTLIRGRNGSGKTTVGTAHYWLWTDKDYELNSNPNIRPNDGRDCVVTVEEILDDNGTEITFSKSQKMRKSKDGKVSLINSFMVNGLEKTAAAVKEFFASRGIDTDKVANLSNPNAFMEQNAKDMRALLFSMASAKTDAEIAAGLDNVSEVQELLKSYKLDEIEALQKQAIKTVNNEHGKSGELTAAKISSLETFKVDVDTAELELQKKALEQEIADYKSGADATEKRISELQTAEMRLQFDMSAIAQRMTNEFLAKKRQTEWDLQQKNTELSQAKTQLEKYGEQMKEAQHQLEAAESLKQPINEQYKEINARVFDEAKYRITDSDKVCPTCGKPFDEDKIAELVQKSQERIKHEHDNFLAYKEADKKEVMAKADALKATIAEREKSIADIAESIKQANDTVEKVTAERDALQTEYDSYPDSPDFAQNAEYSRLKAEHDKVTAEYQKNQNEGITEPTNGIEDKQRKLNRINAEITKAEQNAQIDERISKLEEQGRQYEQQRANAEKVLYQVKQVRMRKNRTLEAEINSHFAYAKWKMFKTQKNGEIVDDCTPYIDGYDYGISANHGREIVMQLDICYSLQRYFNQHLPVFLDNAESLNESNYITQDGTQLIALAVDDCDLTVKKMEV